MALGIKNILRNRKDPEKSVDLSNESLDRVGKSKSKKSYDDDSDNESDFMETKVRTADLARDFADNTTAHGPNRISGAENVYERWFWVLLFSGLLGYTLYGCASQIMTYFEWPVSTTISIVREPSQIFPAVTICNQNRIRSSLLHDSSKYHALPAIDANMKFCSACNNILPSKKKKRKRRSTEFDHIRRKRSIHYNDENDLEYASELLKSLHDCSHNFDFADTDEEFRANFMEKFVWDIRKLQKEIQDVDQNDINHNLHRYKRHVMDYELGDGDHKKDIEFLNLLADKMTEPGRNLFRDKRFSRSTGNLTQTDTSEEFLVNHDYYIPPTYSDTVANSTDWWGFLNSTDPKDLQNLANWATVDKADTLKYGHTAEEMIVSCKFDQKETCTYENFHQFQHKKYGNCFTFNNNNANKEQDARRTSRSGSEYGLELLLFIDQPEYIGMFTHEAGVRVSIHNIDTTPFPEDRGYNAAPGMSTNFNIRFNKMYRTKLPYGGEDCTEREVIRNNVYDGRYSFLACEKACVQTALREYCQCITDINTLYTDVPICDLLNTQHNQCREDVHNRFLSGDLECDCVQRCDETYFSVKYSTSAWPSEKYEGYLFSGLSHNTHLVDALQSGIEATMSNIVKLHFTLEELNMQTITEEPEMTWFILTSNLGGNCGLFIGLSFVTAFEILTFILDLVMHGCLWSRVKGEIDAQDYDF